MIGDYLEVYTFDYLMAQALSQVPNTVDKRQGSIIYDALAPACYRLADFYNTLRNVYKDTFAETATGESLDYRVAEQGITRYSATCAIKKAYFASAAEQPMAVPLGARFSTISDVNPITYAVISAYAENGVVQPGYYQLQCEGHDARELGDVAGKVTEVVIAADDADGDRHFGVEILDRFATRAPGFELQTAAEAGLADIDQQ